MGAFVNVNARVTVADENGNTVTVRAKMSISVNANVVAELKRFNRTAYGQDLALLVHNIVAWDGPLFQDDAGRPVKCNRQNIFSLDPTNSGWAALQTKVLTKIDELNRKPTVETEETDPN